MSERKILEMNAQGHLELSEYGEYRAYQIAFEKLLGEKSTLLADGATGTTFFGMGLQSGDAPELWNTDYPDRVGTHYQAFVDAGSDLILTNSFGGTRYRLKLHNAQDRVTELNVAAAAILRQVADNSERDIIVAGSIGPTGEILAPLGTLEPEAAVAAFAEQALALEQGDMEAAKEHFDKADAIVQQGNIDPTWYANQGIADLQAIPGAEHINYGEPCRAYYGQLSYYQAILHQSTTDPQKKARAMAAWQDAQAKLTSCK